MVSKYIVFNSNQQAIDLNNRITSVLLSVWTDGVTNNYCELKKHPNQDLWAVVVESGYEQYFTNQELISSIELTSDWNTEPNIE